MEGVEDYRYDCGDDRSASSPACVSTKPCTGPSSANFSAHSIIPSERLIQKPLLTFRRDVMTARSSDITYLCVTRRSCALFSVLDSDLWSGSQIKSDDPIQQNLIVRKWVAISADGTTIRYKGGGPLNTRVTRRFVTIPAAFQLKGMSETRPAGVYEVTTTEETIGDFIYEAYRRVSTTIYLPPRSREHGMGQIIETDPTELALVMQPTTA